MPVDFLADFRGELESRINSCNHHPAVWELAPTLEGVHEQWEQIQQCRAEAKQRHLRWFAKHDLFFLGRYILGWDYVDHPWQFARAREVQADPDGVLDLWCFSDDTEFLTRRGWVLGADLRLEDGLATRNPETKELEWQSPSAINVKPYVGRMVRLYSKNLGEFLVTPNHRVLAKTQEGAERFELAENLVGKSSGSGWQIPVTSIWRGVPIGEQRFGDVVFSGDDFCAFMGMWLAEGSVRKPAVYRGKYRVKSGEDRISTWIRQRNEIQIAQQESSKGYAPFKELLSKLDVHIGCGGGKFTFNCAELRAYLSQFGGALEKFIPEIVLNATPEQLRIFWRYFALGDGNAEAVTLYTSSVRMADQLVEVAQKMGFSASRLVDARVRDRLFADGHTAHTENPNYIVTLRRTEALRFNCEETQYAGNVVCPSVPNGTVYVRRNGKSIWSGNSRGHCKTTWKTYALSIQNILNNPNVAICIFSHTRPVAKAFLRVIKQIFETNTLLRKLFPDIIWDKTDAAPKWNEDDGISVKRAAVRLEQTVEAYGLVDGQPTSRHYDILLYDDVVTLESVTSAEMMTKTTDAWGVSLNLAMPDTKVRLNGTFYHENDTYHAIIKRGIRVRRYPIFELDDAGHPIEDRPVFFTIEQVEEKRKQGVRNFAFQCLLDEKLDTTKERWRIEWINRYAHKISLGVNVYILVDPANEKQKHSDYTVMAAVGLGADQNFYLLDLIRDRLNLKQRTDRLFGLHQKYMRRGLGMRPQDVGYEQYGKDSDIQHIQEKMDSLNYHFNITPLGGRLSKKDRINKLQPTFEEKRWWFPPVLYQTDYEGKQIELISTFINEEFLHWPDPTHDDILDCLSRILDPKFHTAFPIGEYVGAVSDYPEPDSRPRNWQTA